MKPRIAILSATIFAGTLAGAAVFAAVRPSDASPGEPTAEARSQVADLSASGVLTANEASFAVTQSSFEGEHDEHDGDHHDEHDDDHNDSHDSHEDDD